MGYCIPEHQVSNDFGGQQERHTLVVTERVHMQFM